MSERVRSRWSGTGGTVLERNGMEVTVLMDDGEEIFLDSVEDHADFEWAVEDDPPAVSRKDSDS